MRLIKFRFFDTYTSIMIPWEDVKYTGLELESCFEMTSMKVMQFTGLTDKNGVDIYEGDILINEVGRICEVKWHEYQAGFDCEFIKGTNYQKDTDMTLGFINVHLHIFTEIIGNIYQSPELLEK